MDTMANLVPLGSTLPVLARHEGDVQENHSAKAGKTLGDPSAGENGTVGLSGCQGFDHSHVFQADKDALRRTDSLLHQPVRRLHLLGAVWLLRRLPHCL